ncbi:hypothetical protein [Phytohabitans houttuyneae]|uniref:hypothetical protein n=1 Tax=Phytohabitans houttuyneae TaxID=1076126 RepID=UPI0015664B00|nr:hypothetical protein [Phytohabitans houttuyneae]
MTELSPMARALLSDDLGGRDVVPGHVADRVAERAEEWITHGFTVETVRAWQDLPPAAAAYLAERGSSRGCLTCPSTRFRAPLPCRCGSRSARSGFRWSGRTSCWS